MKNDHLKLVLLLTLLTSCVRTANPFPSPVSLPAAPASPATLPAATAPTQAVSAKTAKTAPKEARPTKAPLLSAVSYNPKAYSFQIPSQQTYRLAASETQQTATAIAPAAFNNGVHSIFYSPPEELKKNAQLPANIELMKSMNNVDIVLHEGRYYMAFRTAPSHFASAKALMHLLSSPDGKQWVLENTWKMERDVREPRFMSFKGKLFFYFFTLGTNPLAFEPDTMYVTERGRDGWSAIRPFYEKGFVPWRARVWGDKAYMSVYYGRGLYGGQENPAVRLLESSDGLNWAPLTAAPQVALPGAEEPEFEFDEEGNIWGTIRLENNGGMIFYADRDNLGLWKTVKLKDKYDSALMLKHDGQFYLFARRNVDGSMDKAPGWWPDSWRKWYNLARYSLTTKRTSLYHFDRANFRIAPLFDFPSHGDTAFPAIAPINDKQYWFLNYSSELGEGKDYRWLKGQLKPTRLYSHVLTFEKPE